MPHHGSSRSKPSDIFHTLGSWKLSLTVLTAICAPLAPGIGAEPPFCPFASALNGGRTLPPLLLQTLWVGPQLYCTWVTPEFW